VSRQCSTASTYIETAPFNNDYRLSTRYGTGSNFTATGVLTLKPNDVSTLADPCYRTSFGLTIAHSAVIYEDSNRARISAVNRYIRTRGTLAEELALRATADQAIIRFRPIFIDMSKELLYDMFSTCDNGDEDVDALTHEPHPKKHLREQTFSDCADSGIFHELGTVKVAINVKRVEFAKPNKKERAIGDFGCAASLVGARLMGDFKDCLGARRYDCPSGKTSILFVKSPTPDTMFYALSFLLEEIDIGSLRMVYFSDDACIRWRHVDRDYFGNMDISSCDCSHRPLLFDLLLQTTTGTYRQRMKLLVDQCRLPIRVMNKTEDSGVLLSHVDPKLYSGSSITTFINCYANSLIAFGLDSIDLSHTLPSDIPNLVRQTSGYVVTFDGSEHIEGLQFLKMSPFLVSNHYGSWSNKDTSVRFIDPPEYGFFLNLGTLFRTLGRCKYDVPGSGPFESRFICYVYDVYYGIFGRYSGHVYDTMFRRLKILRSKYSYGLNYSTQQRIQQQAKRDYGDKFSSDDLPHVCVPDEVLMRRYDATLDEIYEFCSLFDKIDVGLSIRCPFTDKVLLLDYGLPVLPLDCSPSDFLLPDDYPYRSCD